MSQNGDGNGTKTAPETAFIPGKHGGRLLPGGKPGNRGGGRTPSALRDAMRQALKPRIKIAQQIADNPDSSPSDRLKAIDLLAKYGLGTTVTETDTEGRDAPRPQVIAYIPENGRVSRR